MHFIYNADLTSKFIVTKKKRDFIIEIKEAEVKDKETILNYILKYNDLRF